MGAFRGPCRRCCNHAVLDGSDGECQHCAASPVEAAEVERARHMEQHMIRLGRMLGLEIIWRAEGFGGGCVAVPVMQWD